MMIIVLLSTLVTHGMTASFNSAHSVQCSSQLKQIYYVAQMFSEDINRGKSGAREHTFGNWSSLFQDYHKPIGEVYMCPSDKDDKSSISVDDYKFHYTWNGGGDIPIAPGPRGKVFKTYNNPKGWRIGLEDWNDADYNDLVVDVLQYPTWLEIKTVSADLGGDIHFTDNKGNVLIYSLPKKLGQVIRIQGGELTSYGMHQSFDGINIAKLNIDQPSDTIFMMDYNKVNIMPGEDDWSTGMDPASGRYSFERHFSKMNVTFSDGSVRAKSGFEVDPLVEGNLNKYWQVEGYQMDLTAYDLPVTGPYIPPETKKPPKKKKKK